MSTVHIDSLADWVEAHGPLDAATAVRAALAMLDGLDAVHAQGRTHGSVNPRNVRRRTDGDYELAGGDLGLSGWRNREVFLGRRLVAFDAPEVQKDVDACSVPADLYGVGVSLAWAIVGQPELDSYRAEDLGALREAAPPLWDVVERVTRYTVAERHPTVAALRADLGAVLDSLEAPVQPAGPPVERSVPTLAALPTGTLLLFLLFLGLALGALAVLALA
jgi:hypothetical protein